MMTSRLSNKIASTTLLLFLCSRQWLVQGNQTNSTSDGCPSEDHPYVYGDNSDMPFGNFDPLLTNSCGLVKRTVDWPSGDIKDSPDIVSTPGECCQLCIETEKCRVWVFRACCNHCWLKSDIYEERACDGVDCIGGIRPGYSIEVDPDEKTCTQGSVVPEPTNEGTPDELDILGAALFACKAVEGLLVDDSDCPTLRSELWEETDCSRGALEKAQSLPQCTGWRQRREERSSSVTASPLCGNEDLTPAALFHYYARLVCGTTGD